MQFLEHQGSLLTGDLRCHVVLNGRSEAIDVPRVGVEHGICGIIPAAKTEVHIQEHEHGMHET